MKERSHKSYGISYIEVISDYLRPLCESEFSINDTKKFPNMLSSIPPLQDDEEDVSYDVESLFTNIR